jgi:hypothetical protein
MTFDHADRFVVLLSGGAGMLLAGAANALLGRAAARSRALVVGAGCGLALGGAAAWSSDSRLLAAAAGVMAVGVVPALLAGSGWVVALLQRPGVRWGLLAALGLGTATGAAALYQYEDDTRIERDMADIGLSEKPPLPEQASAYARTDRGAPVPLKRSAAERTGAEAVEAEERFLRTSPFRDQVIHRHKADDGANCHGWVFTGGRYWVTGESVEPILRENGYAEVSDPRPGDLAIYRQGSEVSHTAVVRYVADGAPPLVEGKWSWMGVYLHPAEVCPYGTDVKFYRSPRRGHLLAGMDELPSPGR